MSLLPFFSSLQINYKYQEKWINKKVIKVTRNHRHILQKKTRKPAKILYQRISVQLHNFIAHCKIRKYNHYKNKWRTSSENHHWTTTIKQKFHMSPTLKDFFCTDFFLFLFFSLYLLSLFLIYIVRERTTTRITRFKEEKKRGEIETKISKKWKQIYHKLWWI